MRVLVALALVFAIAGPAFASYYFKDLQVAADVPTISGTQLKIGGVTVREEPCTRPDATIVMDVWAFPQRYDPAGLGQYGFPLASINLPPPGVQPDGACQTQYVPGAATLTVRPPPTGNYELEYFIRVTPSRCPDREPDCYEDVLGRPYYMLNENELAPYREPMVAPGVHAWRETLHAVEFFHRGLGHYFLTASPAEITALDSGAIAGWERTGESFDVHASGSLGRTRVCRFYGIFAAQGTHFYTAHEGECTGLMNAPFWQYESVLGYVYLPGTLGCVFAPAPIYRLYNAGMGGAPNHRYTTSLALRADMIARGWISEGYGDLGIIGCVP